METFEQIVLILYTIAYLIAVPFIIRDAILALIPIIKCIGISGCKKDDCRFRHNCKRISLSDKEIADFKAYINRMH